MPPPLLRSDPPCGVRPTSVRTVCKRVDALGPSGPERVVPAVDLILGEAVRRAASDVHFEPTPRGARNPLPHRRRAAAGGDAGPRASPRMSSPGSRCWRSCSPIASDIPQEGRIRPDGDGMRRRHARQHVSDHPRRKGGRPHLQDSAQTARPGSARPAGRTCIRRLARLLRERTGAIFLTGPSGSGKTTTIYACLRHLVRERRRPAHRHHRGSGRAGDRRRQPVAGPAGHRVRLRPRPAQPAAAGSGSHHGRRGPRPETAAHRHRGGADRPPGLQHAARRLGLRRRRPAAGDGHRAVSADQRPQGHSQSAAGAPPVRRLSAAGRSGAGRRSAASAAGHGLPQPIPGRGTTDAHCRLAAGHPREGRHRVLEAVAAESGWQTIRAAADAAVAAGQSTAEEVRRVLGPVRGG